MIFIDVIKLIVNVTECNSRRDTNDSERTRDVYRKCA